MKKNRLLENLSQEIESQIPMRRYSLADMISESYRTVYDCEDGSNMKRLAESHLADVKQNPRDIERLSRQMCIIKEMKKLTESGELKDEDLVDKKKYDTVEPNEDRVLQTECNESAGDWDAFLDSPEYDEAFEDWYKEMRIPGVDREEHHVEFQASTPCEDAYKRWQEDNKVNESRAPRRTRRRMNESFGTRVAAWYDRQYDKMMDANREYGSQYSTIGTEAPTTEFQSRLDKIDSLLDKYDTPENNGDIDKMIDSMSDEDKATVSRITGIYESRRRRPIKESVGAVGAKVGDTIVDTKTGKEGKVQKLGQSGNYGLIYVDFGNGLRKINPMDDAQRFGRYTLKKDSVNEADDPELTKEEEEELVKYLDTIRKEKKNGVKTDMSEAKEPKRRGIKCHIADSKNPKKELNEESYPTQWVTQYGVDILYTEGQEDVENKIEFALEKAGLTVLGCQPTDAEWSVEDYEKLVGYKIGESKKSRGKRLKESSGTWSDTESGDKVYKPSNPDNVYSGYVGKSGDKYEAKIISGRTLAVSSDDKKVCDTEKEAMKFIEDRFSEKFPPNVNESKSYRGLQNFKKQSEGKAFYKTFKKMHDTLKEGKALTRQESIDLYKAANSALTQMSIELEHNPEFLKTFNESSTLLSADVNSLRESLARGKAPSKNTMKSLAKFSEALLCESPRGEEEAIRRWAEMDREGGRPVESYREFSKICLDEEGIDPTKELYNLYLEYYNSIDESKKVNEADDDESKMSRYGIMVNAPDKDGELKDKYRHILSIDAHSREEAIAIVKKKYPGMVIMNESEDEEDVEDEVAMDEVPADEETPEDDFVGDDEGDVQSEEADAFDQEYADARVALHKELAEKHADDPDVQDKLAQDAEEVTNLPGITDDQIAELNSEESTDDVEDEPTEDPVDDEEPTEEEPVEDEDDSEITDDELEELKKHLKEMRSAKLKESEEVDLVSQVKKALDDAGIRYSTKGRSGDRLIVSKKDLQKASEIRNKIDPDYRVTVQSQA